MHKLSINRTFFYYLHEECPKGGLLWNLGLDIPFDGVLQMVIVFVSHPFSCINDLKMDNAIFMAPWMVSTAFFVYKL